VAIMQNGNSTSSIATRSHAGNATRQNRRRLRPSRRVLGSASERCSYARPSQAPLRCRLGYRDTRAVCFGGEIPGGMVMSAAHQVGCRASAASEGSRWTVLSSCPGWIAFRKVFTGASLSLLDVLN